MKQVMIQDVTRWVNALHTECENTITKTEKNEQHKYATLIQNPQDKVFLTKLLDESSQIRNQWKLAKRVRHIIAKYGVPEFFSFWDGLLLRAFQYGGFLFAPVAIPIFKKRLRMDTAAVIIDEEPQRLYRHLTERKKLQIGQNLNLLGEVVFSDSEADARYHHYLEAIEKQDINYISIKLSSIYAQMHALNFRTAREALIDRVTAIFQKAIDCAYTDSNGILTHKFINLDMEEYKDAHLTLDVFITVLSLPQFKNYQAGIVIQAYLEDAEALLLELLDFAKKRVAEGGAPLKMRLVKGANLQMESVISSLRGWPNPIRGSKVEVDANFYHLLDIALQKENAVALHVGVASHNLYSIAYAHLLSQQNGVDEFVTYEMLEGMANHLWRAMRKLGHRVILYTPVVNEKNFLNAISYLVRRLDENTGEDNFLSYSFNLKPDTTQWDFLYQQFVHAMEMKDKVVCRMTRNQDRRQSFENISGEEKTLHPTRSTLEPFCNEPDTDFDLTANKLWAESIVEKWKKPDGYEPEIIPVQIGYEQKITEKRQRYIEHNQQHTEICVYEMSKASVEDIEKIIAIAHEDKSGWATTSVAKRKEILHHVADLLAAKRGDMIGVMCAVTGKTITEGDVEVSEAIDFCRFYPLTMEAFEELKTVRFSPKGVVVVISPWNFPFAIPCGGVVAALSGGNRVILKPATVAAPIAWEFAKCFWDAGVPKDALQVVICDGSASISLLTTSPWVRHTILTGGTDTAQQIQKNNPTTPLSAETGGKNAIILTGLGSRGKAIKNVMTSAFNNAGQKCSACSLFLVEKEIYDDPAFKQKLREAAINMKTGFNWEIGNIVGSMITNRNDQLDHVFNNLEPGQEWLVEPEYVDDQKYILRPTILWGVKPDSYIFRTELFAPVLAVVRVDSLREAVELVNSLDYGLTSGLNSLDESEQRYWRDHIEAGNL
ncbi:MAG: bifunctional proline dehydrogenase/L-glutamate gamma-semialdehyde dehydrogenase [Tannerella sp.]|jgi:RHH-type proline utilization regulon transcriptional repressor/proline dehydrogenase/delta 1-pyrroline-5-carboxylate dehydrogenase|nr:bifunctional proline dehydrogenase/L-glutamate gamma-semialdehyde dehydrogenase [Tannerella sp.]